MTPARTDSSAPRPSIPSQPTNTDCIIRPGTCGNGAPTDSGQPGPASGTCAEAPTSATSPTAGVIAVPRAARTPRTAAPATSASVSRPIWTLDSGSTEHGIRPTRVLPAVHGDDDGVVHDADVKRTFRAVFRR